MWWVFKSATTLARFHCACTTFCHSDEHKKSSEKDSFAGMIWGETKAIIFLASFSSSPAPYFETSRNTKVSRLYRCSAVSARESSSGSLTSFAISERSKTFEAFKYLISHSRRENLKSCVDVDGFEALIASWKMTRRVGQQWQCRTRKTSYLCALNISVLCSLSESEYFCII